MRIVAAQINPMIADVPGNVEKIIQAIQRAKALKAKLIVFPELSLCGYCPEDLLFESRLILSMEEGIRQISKYTEGVCAIVGMARKNPKGKEKPLYNSAAIVVDQKILGYQDKLLLPTYDVFDERRYFEPGEKTEIWSFHELQIAVTICEDLWQHADRADLPTRYLRDPVEELRGKKIDLIVNLSGSPYSFGRFEERVEVFAKTAKTLHCPLLFCNQVGANDQLIFDGESFFLDQKGEMTKKAKGFVEDDLCVDLGENGARKEVEKPIEKLYQALVLGVRDYFRKQRLSKAILGLSGGIDSGLTACIAVEALGAENVRALFLPSRYSSQLSRQDSQELAKRLGMGFQEISIEPFFTLFLKELQPHFLHQDFDVTEENLQARIRAVILMAFANKEGSLLLNTSNKSEMALGYCTLYGDMAGALGVLQDVLKTQVYALAHLHPSLPLSMRNRPPSAELRFHQTDLDTLPPFEVLDPILEQYLEKALPIETIAKNVSMSLDFVHSLIERVHKAEYKRRQAPIGLRVSKKAFSKGRCVPIVERGGLF